MTASVCRSCLGRNADLSESWPGHANGWQPDYPDCIACYHFAMFGGWLEPARGDGQPFQAIYGINAPTVREPEALYHQLRDEDGNLYCGEIPF